VKRRNKLEFPATNSAVLWAEELVTGIYHGELAVLAATCILTYMKTVTDDDVRVSPQVVAWLRGGEEIVVLLPDSAQARLVPLGAGRPAVKPADAATIRQRFSEARAEQPARDLSGVVDENKGDS
jgi:antitoxin (DNA-binding transcriptional repressor) of toxin-antitoxin stability system